jgi:hypothetical protein
VDSELVPDDLRAENALQVAAADFPLAQTNPVTGCQSMYYRVGTDANYLGWIKLMNADESAGYIMIRRPLQPPLLAVNRAIVTDVLPEFLGPLLTILHSDEPLQIRYYQESADSQKYSFLEHRNL